MSDTIRHPRRRLLGTALLAAGAVGTPHHLARASSADKPTRLIVVMLRGAVDGLSVVVPHGDADYRHHRGDILIPPPGEPEGALRLDAFFSMHPALGTLMPWWQQRRLAFVHASGSHDPSRSHFDAQDHMESGTPGRRSTPDGWLNRLLSVLAEPSGTLPVRGVHLGSASPRILSGAAQVAALPLSSAERTVVASSPMQAQALERLYGADAGVAGPWTALQQTRQSMLEANDPAMGAAMNAVAPGAVPLAGLAHEAARLGRLLRREPSMRAAFLSVGGWDTHNAQGGSRGQLADRLRALAGGLDALARGLDDRLDDTVILVMSEFGRTVRQNGTRGTDHGHGNVMWLLGGPVRGGQVAGHWPGLDTAGLYEGRDLAVTTDFRYVIAQVLQRQLKLDDRSLARVLPDGIGPAVSDPAIDLIRG